MLPNKIELAIYTIVINDLINITEISNVVQKVNFLHLTIIQYVYPYLFNLISVKYSIYFYQKFQFCIYLLFT